MVIGRATCAFHCRLASSMVALAMGTSTSAALYFLGVDGDAVDEWLHDGFHVLRLVVGDHGESGSPVQGSGLQVS